MSTIRTGSAAAAFLIAALSLLPAGAAHGEAILSPVRFPGLDPSSPSLNAFLSMPEGAGPFPALVLLHGCGGMFGKSGMLNARHRAWDDVLRRAGFAALHVDSFTPRGVTEICTRTDRPVSVWKDRRSDAYAALAYLKSLPSIRPDAIGVMGWSHGGLVTLAALERDDADPGMGFFAGVAFYPACRTPERDSLRPAGPLLMLLGEADDWTPPKRCEPVAADARRRGEIVEVMTYPGAFHGFDWPGNKVHVRRGLARTRDGTAHVGEDPAARADAVQRVPEFLRRHLPAIPGPSSP